MMLMRRNSEGMPAVGSLLDNFFNNDLFDWSSRNFSNTNTTLPAVNIKEDEESFMVEVAAPGMDKKDFKIELDNNLLTISSEKQEEKSENGKEGKYTRREFSYQSFSRSFNLPDTVAADKIQARYAEGVLKLEIPKKEEAKPKPARTIKIS